MANTFLAARGFDMGASRIEEDRLDIAKTVIEETKEKGVRLILPDDFIAAAGIEDTEGRCVIAEKFPQELAAFDIGENSIAKIVDCLKDAKTIFWNGPMGVFENSAFAKGTFEVAKAVAESGSKSIIGGGDSVAAINKAGLADKITHISTGGGASLKFIEGKELPAVKALCE